MNNLNRGDIITFMGRQCLVTSLHRSQSTVRITFHDLADPKLKKAFTNPKLGKSWPKK